MGKLEFHPEAAKRIGELAEDLIANVTGSAKPVEDSNSSTFSPDVVIDHTIREADVLTSQMTETRQVDGVEVRRVFDREGRPIAIDGDTLAEFWALCDRVGKQKAFRDSVTPACITDALHGWIQSRLNGASVPPLPDHMTAQLSKDIEEREVWVPLPNLSLQSTVPIARGSIRPVTRETIDRWKERIPEVPGRERDRANFEQLFENHRRDFQGYSAGVFSVTANSGKAGEIGVERTQDGIALLRLFHPGCLEPKAVCTTDVKYAATRETYTVIGFSGTSVTLTDATPGKHTPWRLANEAIGAIRKAGLDDLSTLLERDDPSMFETECATAIKLYSRAPLWVDLEDRLLYILVPLESIFLKSQTESIQQNLGERLAWFVGRDLAERKKIVAATRAAYELRSSFVHHGAKISATPDLREFMMYAWRAMINLPGVAAKYKERQQFLTRLDDQKLS